MDSAINKYSKCFSNYKIVIIIFIFLLIPLFINNHINNGIKFLIFIVYCILLFLLLEDNIYCHKNNENFDNSDYNSKFQYHYDNPVGMTDRQTRLYNLNKDRGYLGHFYVKCNKCNNNKLNTRNNCSPELQFNKINKLSFYNDHYVDTDVSYCYDCLLDNDTKSLMRNYRNFPYINGPPGTSTFKD